jgi:SEC-C motif-containing protein
VRDRETAPHVNEHSEKIPREREESSCPCKSRARYAGCCMPFHYGRAKPETAEQLMRSRYSAYFFRLIDYLVDTTHPDTREPGLKEELDRTVHEVNWCNLTIVSSSKGGKDDKVGKVEFVAEYFLESQRRELRENSRFKRFKGGWKYLAGKACE